MDRFKFRLYDKNKKEMRYEVYATDYDLSQTNDARFVLMQCTGLRDRKGKLVYEGDIVREVNITGRDEEYVSEVKWVNAGFDLSVDPDFSIEVLGNIYENPNLLFLIEE
jgi:uncharacterized phage protein (TIGR01671 family)